MTGRTFLRPLDQHRGTNPDFPLEGKTMPVGTAHNRPESAVWQGAVQQARATAHSVSTEARRHRVELLVLAATMGFVLIVLLLGLAVVL
jgi:hypothetical protein